MKDKVVKVRSVKDKIKADDLYEKLMNIYDLSKKFVDCATVTQEIEMAHAARSVRHLNGAKATKLVKASQLDQATRSRAVELMMHTIKTLNPLDLAYRHCVQGLIVKYSKSIPATSKADKQSYVEFILQPVSRRIEELERIQELAELVISDIDKAAWSLSLSMNSITLGSKREMQL